MVLSFRLQSEVCNIKNFLIIYSKNIQTFPESFQFVGGKSDVNSMIGNAVPVNLAKYVGSALMRYIMSNESRDNNEGN